MQSLRALVREFPSVLLGYSGGVDSALLAVVLRQELGRDRMLAAIGRSASYPDAQSQVARDVAARFNIPLVEIQTHELEDENYLANPTNRCFYCKTELWHQLVPLARERGLAVVCDGTNADDLREHGRARQPASRPVCDRRWRKQDSRRRRSAPLRASSGCRRGMPPRRPACRVASSTDSRSRRRG